MSARIAVDIGGTFTDVVLERVDGSRVAVKVLTTPAAPEEGFIEGVRAALAKAALRPGDVLLVLHGTTLATNALIERRGARTALLTTEGHRDSLEMAYENRFEQYDVMIDRPAPLVPRRLRLPVRERMNWRGEALVPLDAASVLEHVPLLKQEGIESVAIGFLHAYANPDHERRAAALLAGVMPGLSITLAGEVAPEIREYERLSTAVANAYVRPLMERYLGRLGALLREAGVEAPCLLMTSGGGLATIATASRFPIRLVESGPAGGAVLAAAFARARKDPRVLSFDMGGTTAKLCLIDDGVPKTARAFEVDRSYRFKKGSGLPVRIPVIEMVEIGAGGGSIAHVDALGRLRVGPESAGSVPGPACYGRGGARPTVTDADVALGKILPERFAGGSVTLDVDAARQALASGGPDFKGFGAAHAVAEIVDETMAAAARAHAAEEGADLSDRSMVAFGGAAPLHAARLAEKLGVSRVFVPPDAGVGSAVGFLLAPASYEIVRSLPMRLGAFDADAVAALFEEMRAEAAATLLPAVGESPLTERRAAFMRYHGQGHEVAVALAGTPTSADGLGAAFEAAYARLFGRTVPGMEIEALTWSLSLAGPAARVPDAQDPAPSSPPPDRSVTVIDAASGGPVVHHLLERARLAQGATFDGPALVVEDQTTTVVPPGWRCAVDGGGALRLTRLRRPKGAGS